jgi:hypothetical protein
MTEGRVRAPASRATTALIVVVAVSLNVAIFNLAFDAVNRSYRVVVPTDVVARRVDCSLRPSRRVRR